MARAPSATSKMLGWLPRGRGSRLLPLAGLALLLWAALASLFAVDISEYGLVSRFGRIVRVVDVPGLHLKLPFDRVMRLDRRLLYSRPARAEYLTADKKNVVVQSLATWRIAEPVRFVETLGTRASAEQRLADVILAEIGAVMGQYPFASLVSGDDGEARLWTMVAEVRAAVAMLARSAYGIEIVDVDVRKLYLPEQNKQSVFERMKAERGKIATQYRSEGERDAAKLIAAADAEKTRIMANAYERARVLRAEGEAEAIRIYAEGFGEDPSLYKFLRTLEAYREFLDETTTMFLPADAEVFGLLRFEPLPADEQAPAPQAEQAPDDLAVRPGDHRLFGTDSGRAEGASPRAVVPR